MNGWDVNGLGWTSAIRNDLDTAAVWAIDETERSAKKTKAARMETSVVTQTEGRWLRARTWTRNWSTSPRVTVEFTAATGVFGSLLVDAAGPDSSFRKVWILQD
jgi:hypothetical protein